MTTQRYTVPAQTPGQKRLKATLARLRRERELEKYAALGEAGTGERLRRPPQLVMPGQEDILGDYRRRVAEAEAQGTTLFQQRKPITGFEALGNLGRATPATVAEVLPGEAGRRFRATRERLGPLEAFRQAEMPSVQVPEGLRRVAKGVIQAHLPGPIRRLTEPLAEAVVPTQLGVKGALEAFAQPDILLPGAIAGVRGARAAGRALPEALVRAPGRVLPEAGLRLAGAQGVAGGAPTYSKTLQQAFKEARASNVYTDARGSYRLKSVEGRTGSMIAPWNKEARATFANPDEFHKAATRGYVAHQGQFGIEFLRPAQWRALPLEKRWYEMSVEAKDGLVQKAGFEPAPRFYHWGNLTTEERQALVRVSEELTPTKPVAAVAERQQVARGEMIPTRQEEAAGGAGSVERQRRRAEMMDVHARNLRQAYEDMVARGASEDEFQEMLSPLISVPLRKGETWKARAEALVVRGEVLAQEASAEVAGVTPSTRAVPESIVSPATPVAAAEQGAVVSSSTAAAPPPPVITPEESTAAGVRPPSPAAAPLGGRPRGRVESEAVGQIAQGREATLPIVDNLDDFARSADPSGGGKPPDKPPVPRGRKGAGEDPDEVFARVRQVASRGESIPQTLLRRHEAAITTAENEARIALDEGTKRLRGLGIGEIRMGRFVPRQQDVKVLDELFEALHNPSKVVGGEVQVPKGFEGEYARLRDLTDWEEAMRLDFDPAMATVEDYFYRGWLWPKDGVARFTGAPSRGRLGTIPPFKKPRVDASYREMRDAGFEPISWNPYEQWRISRLQGVRYRQQMQLIEDLKKLELAQTEASGIGVEGWRTPRVGPAFEGKPFATADAMGEPAVMYSRRFAVPDGLANMLENMYGITPNLGNVHVGNRSFDLMKAIDAVVFLPKRIKLFGSLFQQMDFLNRSHVGAWTGMVDALRAGRPVEAVKHLAVWPKAVTDIVRANFSPGAREAIRRQLNSTTPILPGRPGVSFRGIMEGGLSTIDTTILPRDLDRTARVLAEGMGLLSNKAVRRTITSLESTMRRGLFEGTYPAAQMTDIKNNIAPILARRYPNLSDEALNGMIAIVTNKKYSTIPASQSVVQNRFLRESLRRLIFSMGESEGLLRQATGAIRGPEAAFWRTHWVGAYLGLLAMASAIHFASTGEPLPFKRYLPLSRDKWEILPIGYNQQFAAPDLPIGGEEVGNVLLDIVGQLDTAFRILNPIGFLSSRESVILRAAQTQITGRDYFGRPIDEVGPGGIISRTSHLINDLFAPIGIGQAAVQVGLRQGVIPEKVLPITERGLGVAGHLVQATGLNLRAQYLRQIWDGDLRVYEKVPADERLDFRSDNPTMDAKLFLADQTTSLRSGEAVSEALRLIQEVGANPEDVRGIRQRKEDSAQAQKVGKKLEETQVDRLIAALEAPTVQPAPTPSMPGTRQPVPPRQSTTPNRVKESLQRRVAERTPEPIGVR